MPLFQSCHYLLNSPGATRFAALSACPWLLHFAPLALKIKRFFHNFNSLHFQVEFACHSSCKRIRVQIPDVLYESLAGIVINTYWRLRCCSLTTMMRSVTTRASIFSINRNRRVFSSL